MPNSHKRPTTAYINLDNLESNLRSVRSFVGDGPQAMAIVKADAYGHGAVRCAKKLESAGIDWFGVAIPEEGIELRNAGVDARILCLGSFWDGQERDIIDLELTPVVFELQKAERLNSFSANSGTTTRIHIKIDTGMGRVGVPFRDSGEFAARVKELKNLEIEGVMTHFASAEDPLENDFTSQQIERFEHAVAELKAKGIEPSFIDAANSAGSILHPAARKNLIRLGGVLYGLWEDMLPNGVDLPLLDPVMSLQTEIAFIKTVEAGETLGYGRTYTTTRKSRIATLPIGYTDGYRRSLSNKASVLVRGCFAPVVGRVSMDWTLIDVTDIEDAVAGDNVLLIGSEGGSSISAASLAALSNTISYEITCGISPRVRRVYVDSQV